MGYLEEHGIEVLAVEDAAAELQLHGAETSPRHADELRPGRLASDGRERGDEQRG